jgi:nicotinate-nucleotide adenylyltransferase
MHALRCMKIGLYGGSFDPIHHGHLILAREAREQLGLDRVLFIPAAISPHKLTTVPTPAEARYEMLQAALADEPGFEVEDCDLRRTGPSFAIETVRELCARWPEAQFFYLIGHDNVAKLDTWHSCADLCREVQFVVFGRGEHDAPHAFPTIVRRVDISATEIRARVAQGQSIRYLVPEAVRAIIERRKLYQDPTNRL